MTGPHPVTYSLGVSLDGYIYDADGDFGWADPDDELFDFATNEVRGLSAHLLGSRLYETMLYWEVDEPDPSWTPAEWEFAKLWQKLPKIVFSSTLTEVRGSHTRLATGTVIDEIARLQTEPGEGGIAVGGADLAHAVINADLVDEYRMRIFPVLVGAGASYFSRAGAHSKLRFVETRTFPSGVVYLGYRRARG